jgi:hypothetical protein
MITTMSDFFKVLGWTIALLVAAIAVNLIAIANKVQAAPECIVTDNNPCSAPRGPWGR